jgi:Cys-tRNA(Pro)/Cys-tRNA(Cys) deacylase
MLMPDHKTVAMRLLDQAKITYQVHTLPTEEVRNAQQVAELLGVKPEKVFKTLVTTGKTGRHFVFMLPATAELDLKKAAKAAGEKSVEMLPAKELLGLTGYVHGGCSPVGMKKRFRTFIDQSVAQQDTILFSAGKLSMQLEMPLSSLQSQMSIEVLDLVQAT